MARPAAPIAAEASYVTGEVIDVNGGIYFD